MIGCVTENGVEYITKLEHFRDLMSENTYQALEEFLSNDKEQYQDIIDDLESEISSLKDDIETSDNNFDDLQGSYDNLVEGVCDVIKDVTDLPKEKIIEKLEEMV